MNDRVVNFAVERSEKRNDARVFLCQVSGSPLALRQSSRINRVRSGPLGLPTGRRSQVPPLSRGRDSICSDVPRPADATSLISHSDHADIGQNSLPRSAGITPRTEYPARVVAKTQGAKNALHTKRSLELPDVPTAKTVKDDTCATERQHKLIFSILTLSHRRI